VATALDIPSAGFCLFQCTKNVYLIINLANKLFFRLESYISKLIFKKGNSFLVKKTIELINDDEKIPKKPKMNSSKDKLPKEKFPKAWIPSASPKILPITATKAVVKKTTSMKPSQLKATGLVTLEKQKIKLEISKKQFYSQENQMVDLRNKSLDTSQLDCGNEPSLQSGARFQKQASGKLKYPEAKQPCFVSSIRKRIEESRSISKPGFSIDALISNDQMQQSSKVILPFAQYHPRSLDPSSLQSSMMSGVLERPMMYLNQVNKGFVFM